MIIKKLLKELDILEISDASLLDIDVEDISCNSGDIKKNSLFIAYKGRNFDPHLILEDLFKTGKIVAFVTEKNIKRLPFIRVKNGRVALALAVKNYFSISENYFKSIGITGTNGKTTISYLMDSIFNVSELKTVRLSTTNYKLVDQVLSSSLTTPSAYDFYKLISIGVENGAKGVIAEVSSHALAEDRIYGFRFDLSIFTNLTGDHLDYHENMENYYNAKRKLFTTLYSDTALINLDDDYGRRLYNDIEIKKYSYSLENKTDIKVVSSNFSLDGTKADILLFDKRIEIFSPLVGRHNLYNIIAAIGGAYILGFSIDDIIRGIESLESVPGRLERFEKNGTYLFVDYAHTDDALENVLKTVSTFKKGKVIVVFGCGGNRDKSKRPRMGEIAEKFSDIIILTNDNPRTEKSSSIISQILDGIVNKDKVYVEPDRKKAFTLAYSLSSSGDTILIAGKGHENYQEINGVKNHFDDKEIVKQLFSNKS